MKSIQLQPNRIIPVANHNFYFLLAFDGINYDAAKADFIGCHVVYFNVIRQCLSKAQVRGSKFINQSQKFILLVKDLSEEEFRNNK